MVALTTINHTIAIVVDCALVIGATVAALRLIYPYKRVILNTLLLYAAFGFICMYGLRGPAFYTYAMPGVIGGFIVITIVAVFAWFNKGDSQ